MLKKLTEEDFAVLRCPLESGRQSPSALAPILVLSIFLQALMFVLTYVVAADATLFPYKEEMFVIHLLITGILMLFSIIYSIPNVYMKGQKVQYILTVIVSQNLFGVFFYICVVFIIGKDKYISEESLLIFTYITLLFGLLIFIVTCIRFYVLLVKGQYRKESKKDKLRLKLEFSIQSFLPQIILASISLLFVVQYLVREFGIAEIETIIMMILFILLFYTMLFVLPEQLVILYCKYRFDSFNYNKNGKLKPMGRKGV
ncbi:hypothetical protein QGM71_16970 [Virgibacillus sp. C22-A2]|uniref:ABC transporter ATPase n=1 Tax=Virgibacillus tibetensis TaxID=3042313 RepID=A0ABU6KJ64_9BACI|nr:hypothetical protein [Virgibacillus sp. C22-A2]